jgi:hypothetical protein
MSLVSRSRTKGKSGHMRRAEPAGRGRKKLCERGSECPFKHEHQHTSEYHHGEEGLGGGGGGRAAGRGGHIQRAPGGAIGGSSFTGVGVALGSGVARSGSMQGRGFVLGSASSSKTGRAGSNSSRPRTPAEAALARMAALQGDTNSGAGHVPAASTGGSRRGGGQPVPQRSFQVAGGEGGGEGGGGGSIRGGESSSVRSDSREGSSPSPKKKPRKQGVVIDLT